MLIAVTSTVIFEVPEGDLERVRRRFEQANRVAIGEPQVTVTGQAYTLRALERIEIERRDH